MTDRLTWEYHIPFLGNRLIVRDYLLVVLIVFVSLELLATLLGAFLAKQLWLVPLLPSAILLGVLVLIGLLAFVFRRRDFRFTLDATRSVVEPVSHAGSKAKAAAEGGMVLLGCLALLVSLTRPGYYHSPDLDREPQKDELPWRDVRRVSVERDLRVIALHGSWRRPQRLYCTPANFAAVAAWVRANLPPTAQQGAPLELMG